MKTERLFLSTLTSVPSIFNVFSNYMKYTYSSFNPPYRIQVITTWSTYMAISLRDSKPE